MKTIPTRPEPDFFRPVPDDPRPDRSGPPLVRDGWVRVGGALGFGLLIPRLTDLLGQLTWRDGAYWLGTAWFLLAAAALWEGNRALLLRLRTALRAYPRLLLRLLLITAACVAYTIPVTIGSIACWQWWIGAPFPAANWAVVSFVTTDTVIAAVFLAQAYELLFLQKERERDQLRLARLERARLLADLQAMQGQLAPHFLFNCLNTLSALIEEDPRTAATFNQHLADVARYLLTRHRRDLVPLGDELDFLRAYAALMELRFPHSLRVRFTGCEAPAGLHLPPASLQVLVENAIKHNRFDAAEPLAIEVAREGETMVVAHPHRPRPAAAPASGTGLANLRERVQLLAGRELEVVAAADRFIVRLPLVRAG